MGVVEPSRHATAIPSSSRRAVVIAVAVLAMVHSFLIMLWVMPVNPIRDAVGQQRLSTYVNPYFEQSWSVFAPVPRRGGENVLIRAYVGDYNAGTGELTEWFDITTDEDQRIKYLVNPSRIHSATRRLGGGMNSVLPSLNKEQNRIAGLSFTDTPRERLVEGMLAANTRGAQGRVDVATYARTDEMLTRFATMYATSLWGDEVTLIQFRVGHRTVPNYSKRKDIKFTDVPFDYYTFGLRKAIPGSEDGQKAFDSYVGGSPTAASVKAGQ